MEYVAEKQLAEQIAQFDNERTLQHATAKTKAAKMHIEEQRVARWLASLEQDNALMEEEFQANLSELWEPAKIMMMSNDDKRQRLAKRRAELMERRAVLDDERMRFEIERGQHERGHARLAYEYQRTDHDYKHIFFSGRCSPAPPSVPMVTYLTDTGCTLNWVQNATTDDSMVSGHTIYVFTPDVHPSDWGPSWGEKNGQTGIWRLWEKNTGTSHPSYEVQGLLPGKVSSPSVI